MNVDDRLKTLARVKDVFVDIHDYETAAAVRDIADWIKRENGIAPHPDTTRADAAERMLWKVMSTVYGFAVGHDAKHCLNNEIPGLREWFDAYRHKPETEKRIAALTADLARLDAERERLARELAAIASAPR